MIERALRMSEAWARRGRAARWGVPVAWAATIWFLSSRSPTGAAPGLGIVVLFNAGHVVLFGGLAALLHLAIDSPGGARRFAIAASLAAAYGAVDEIHQAFVPGRQSSVFDWASDAAGAVLCAAALTWLRERPRWAVRTAIAAVPAAVVSVALATVW